MIDVSKCEFEEAYDDPECGEAVYYFTYPKDMDEVEFYSEEDYGNVICMTVALTRNEYGECYLAMSPTTEEGDNLCDVDWRDLHLGLNYTEKDLETLLRIGHEEIDEIKKIGE